MSRVIVNTKFLRKHNNSNQEDLLFNDQYTPRLKIIAQDSIDTIDILLDEVETIKNTTLDKVIEKLEKQHESIFTVRAVRELKDV